MIVVASCNGTGGKREINHLQTIVAIGALMTMMAAADAALAQKQGGVLAAYSLYRPASISIHEEATVFAQRPMMGVFNNLVIFKQDVPQNSLQLVVPDLATGWSAEWLSSFRGVRCNPSWLRRSIWRLGALSKRCPIRVCFTGGARLPSSAAPA